MYRYRHSGLRVASDIPLPEWAEFACAEHAEADVQILLAATHAPDLPKDGTTLVRGKSAGFAVEGVGAWELSGGHRMTIYPAMAPDARELRLFTLGSAWGLLGYQRGDAMWHGSAVELGAKTALFCGAAGEGKSTMAAAMLAAGAALVADDLSRVERMAGGAQIHPSSARIKLWDEAVRHFGWQERVIERDLMREDKFHCSAPQSRAGEAARPLSAIFVLETGERLSAERLTGGEALTAVLAGTIYRPEALDAMGLWAQQGALAAGIVAHTPVWRLTRPRDLHGLDKVAEAVVDVMEALG